MKCKEKHKIKLNKHKMTYEQTQRNESTLKM